MKRYSKRNQLVTLSDLNVTPMLDLAFVLLIIFVIATPLLEQGMKLDLPEGGEPETAMKPEDILTVEVSRDGSQLLLDRQPMNILQLAEAFKKAPCVWALGLSCRRQLKNRGCPARDSAAP